MLDFDFDRAAVAPRDAATLVLVRQAAAGIEIFFVVRHQKSAFMGGACVFPGGKVDDLDKDPRWPARCTPPRVASFALDEAEARAFAVAACREALEEAAILPLAGKELADDALAALQRKVAAKQTTLLAHLLENELTLDLAALVPFSRWVTPVQEARRFDARFFLAVAPPGQRGAHDDHETTASFWATPSEVFAKWERGAVRLAPPTHRTIEQLAQAKTVKDAVRVAERASKDPICPRLVRQVDERGETLALVLPGDPEHSIAEARSPGASRFVLRSERWVPESGCPPLTAPAGTPERR
jgi:8-oxo-dGTP pyrophosphatase MutT (NUDIX family)